MNEQQTLNARAREIGAKIRIAKGWDVWASDGTFYRVSTTNELYQ